MAPKPQQQLSEQQIEELNKKVLQELKKQHVREAINATMGYVYKKPLGSGGFGVVYRVKLSQPKLKKHFPKLARSIPRAVTTVAVKYDFGTESNDELISNARISMRLNKSKYVTKTFGIATVGIPDDDEGVVLTVMELVTGCDLFDLINSTNAVFTKKAMQKGKGVQSLTLQLIHGIADIHGMRLVHRDVKPENVLVDTKTMQLKLTDMGFVCGTEEQCEDWAGTPEVSDPLILYKASDEYGQRQRSLPITTSSSRSEGNVDTYKRSDWWSIYVLHVFLLVRAVQVKGVRKLRLKSPTDPDVDLSKDRVYLDGINDFNQASQNQEIARHGLRQVIKRPEVPSGYRLRMYRELIRTFHGKYAARYHISPSMQRFMESIVQRAPVPSIHRKALALLRTERRR